jgi:Uma2 family endonuclease
MAPVARTPRNSPEVEAAFEKAPETTVAEILDGELFLSPRPHPRHGRATDKLGHQLDAPFDRGVGGPGGWIILVEPELHLGERPDKVVPDIAGWRRERFPPNALDPGTPAFLRVVPDWVCETISPRTEGIDRGRKTRIYRREGVKYHWLLNPLARTLETYRLQRGRWVHLETWEGNVKVRAEPFHAIELDLVLLWSL